MKLTTLVTVSILFALTFVQAQNRLPKEYQSPDEIITLSADMTFEEAFQILSKISYKKEKKSIIDPMKRQGRISVPIVNLPWKNALEIILAAHNLTYRVHEQFYEVIGAEEAPADDEKPTLTTREIRIEALFFEADRSKLAEAGIDWTFFKGSDREFPKASLSVKAGSKVTDEIVEGTFDENFDIQGNPFGAYGLLRAFESNNLGRILSQPEIVVASGKQGRIQVGQDFSIKTRDFAGNVIDNFFSTGTILTVLPVSYKEDNINFIHLILHAERSSAQPDVVSTVINKSEAETEVLLIDGETTMIGGLYTREYSSVRRGVPYLKDLPWWFFGLKYLFGYNMKDTSDKELLVVLRASLVPDLRSRFTKPLIPIDEQFDTGRINSQNQLDESWQEGVISKEKLQ